MQQRILIIIIICLGASVLNVAAQNKIELGISLSFSSQYDYYLFSSDGKGKTTALRDFTRISGFDANATLLFKKNFELNLVVRKNKAEKIFIEGGFWNVNTIILGLGAGIRQTINIQLPFESKNSAKSDKPYELPLDFSFGSYVMGHFLNTDYTFIPSIENSDEESIKNINVEKNHLKFHIELYLAVELRLKFVMDRWNSPVYPAVGFKYFTPLNNYEYCNDPNSAFRLRKKFFYASIYFRF